jgi:acylphosphatase
LEGTARNLPDGRIEVLLEGRKKSILEFIERLKEEKLELVEILFYPKPSLTQG